MRTFVQH